MVHLPLALQFTLLPSPLSSYNEPARFKIALQKRQGILERPVNEYYPPKLVRELKSWLSQIPELESLLTQSDSKESLLTQSDSKFNQPNEYYVLDQIKHFFRSRNLHLNPDHIPFIISLATGNPLVQLNKEEEELMIFYYKKFLEKGSNNLVFIYHSIEEMVDIIANFLEIKISKNLNNDNNYIIDIPVNQDQIIQILEEIKYESILPFIIKLQSFWRMIVAARKLQNLKIQRELESYPGIGIKFREDWDNLTKDLIEKNIKILD